MWFPYPRFESVTKPVIAKELSGLFAGRAFDTLIQARQKPWDQSPDLFSSTNPSYATNGRWDGFGIVNATDNLLSLTYEIGWYGAGAAHPNYNFDTYNFFYLDSLYRLGLHDFFLEPEKAAKRISEICVGELAKEYWQRTGKRPDEYQIDWFKKGAGEKFDNFSAFTVSADHFTFLFAPYQVSSYAMGRWVADVSFYDLLDILKPDGLHLHASPPKQRAD